MIRLQLSDRKPHAADYSSVAESVRRTRQEIVGAKGFGQQRENDLGWGVNFAGTTVDDEEFLHLVVDFDLPSANVPPASISGISSAPGADTIDPTVK